MSYEVHERHCQLVHSHLHFYLPFWKPVPLKVAVCFPEVRRRLGGRGGGMVIWEGTKGSASRGATGGRVPSTVWEEEHMIWLGTGNAWCIKFSLPPTIFRAFSFWKVGCVFLWSEVVGSGDCRGDGLRGTMGANGGRIFLHCSLHRKKVSPKLYG